MQFPNAYKGIKKLFTAEILQLISVFLVVVMAVLGIVTIVAKSPILALVSIILIIVSLALAILSFILNLVGLSQSKKDDASFNTAFIVTIIGIVVSVSSAILIINENDYLRSIFDGASNFLSFVITIFIIQGIVSIADQLGNSDMVERGAKLFKIFIFVNIVSLIAKLISIIFSFIPTTTIIAGGLAAGAGIISIVAYFLYLSLLSKAKKMLKANA